MDVRVQMECREIGTLRLSALPNQIKRMQSAASGGKQCARIIAPTDATRSSRNDRASEPVGTVARSART